jgi:hypothetical protein
MPVKPQLLAWLMCDAVHIDPGTGKHTILGIFSNIRVRQFPAKHPRMVWFLSLTDAMQGEHELAFRFGRDIETQRQLLQRNFKSPGPMHKINLINELHNLPFEEAGEYLITIEVDDEPILVTSLNVSS